MLFKYSVFMTNQSYYDFPLISQILTTFTLMKILYLFLFPHLLMSRTTILGLDRCKFLSFQIIKNILSMPLPKPLISNSLHAPWTRCNTMVLAWFSCSISESIAKSMFLIDIVAGVWENLRTQFN